MRKNMKDFAKNPYQNNSRLFVDKGFSVGNEQMICSVRDVIRLGDGLTIAEICDRSCLGVRSVRDAIITLAKNGELAKKAGKIYLVRDTAA